MGATTSSFRLATPCFFRADGVFCADGVLYYSREAERTPEQQDNIVIHKAVLLEGIPVTCSVCEGKGHVLTAEGRELLAFFDTFLRPRIHEIAADYIDDKMGRG